MRRSLIMRAVVIASLLLITGCTGSSSAHRTSEPTPVAKAASCPVAADAATFQPEVLSPQVHAVGVESCVVDFAARPGRGYWIAVSEKHAIGGGDAYVKALRLPSLPGHIGPHGCFFGIPEPGPFPAVLDASGSLHYPKPPMSGCAIRSEFLAAYHGVRWSAVQVRWITQLLPEGADPKCVPTWRGMEHGQQVPIALAGTGARQFAPLTAREAVCLALPPRAPGPRPSDLIAARVVTDRSAAAPLLAELSRRSGAGGCQPRAWEAFRVYVGGRYVAVADLGPCVRYVPVVPTLPPGLAEVMPTLSDPWETFDADDFTTFVPFDMYSSSYGLKVIQKWRGYVARRFVGNPCRGFVDVSKCQPARATVKDPIALTFTDVPATAAQRAMRMGPGGVLRLSARHWSAGGLAYEQWSLLLRCGRVIGVTASMLATDADTLSAEADDVVNSIAPTSRCP